MSPCLVLETADSVITLRYVLSPEPSELEASIMSFSFSAVSHLRRSGFPPSMYPALQDDVRDGADQTAERDNRRDRHTLYRSTLLSPEMLRVIEEVSPELEM